MSPKRTTNQPSSPPTPSTTLKPPTIRTAPSNYLTARSVSVFLAVTQLTLIGIAAGVLHTKRWTDAGLSPPIASLFWSGIDIFTILRFEKHAHVLARCWYDGLLAVGHVVAAGFFVSMAVVPAFGPAGSVEMAGVGVGVLCCLVGQV